MNCIKCGEKMQSVYKTESNAQIKYHDVQLYACDCGHLTLVVDGVIEHQLGE